MIKSFITLFALQLSLLLPVEAIDVYRISVKGDAPSILEARNLAKQQKAITLKPQDTEIQGSYGFAHLDGIRPPEEVEKAVESGTSLIGSYFTLNGVTRVKLDFREISVKELQDSNAPQLHCVYFEIRLILDDDGYGLWTSTETNGRTEALLIHFPNIESQ